MTDPALGSARNHQGRPWLGPGTGTPVEVRVGPRHSRPRTRIQKEHRRPHPTATRDRSRRWSMACATIWHPTGPQDRHGRPSSLPPTPRDRHDVTRPSHATGSSPMTKKHRRTIKLARALSRNRLVPGRAPRSRSLRKPRAPASAPVAGPVVGFGSWSDPDPYAAADPDPPPGTRVLPGHHPRAGHSRARFNGQHPGVQRQVLSDPHLEPDQIGHPCSRSRRPPPHAAIA
jgi:hypothetical protein